MPATSGGHHEEIDLDSEPGGRDEYDGAEPHGASATSQSARTAVRLTMTAARS